MKGHAERALREGRADDERQLAQEAYDRRRARICACEDAAELVAQLWATTCTATRSSTKRPEGRTGCSICGPVTA